VKFKVHVKDKDSGGWFNSDDHIDDFVHLLRLTPDPNVNMSNWTTVIMHGMRRTHKSR